jgi:phosphoribosylamine--glycine ligase
VGGRVLGITALGANLDAAIRRAYQAVSMVSFEGMQYRKDIGQRALARLHAPR